jgi:hypothetical protein
MKFTYSAQSVDSGGANVDVPVMPHVSNVIAFGTLSQHSSSPRRSSHYTRCMHLCDTRSTKTEPALTRRDIRNIIHHWFVRRNRMDRKILDERCCAYQQRSGSILMWLRRKFGINSGKNAHSRQSVAVNTRTNYQTELKAHSKISG